MQDILFRFALIALFSFAVPFGQQPEKPHISNIAVLPSEPIMPSGDCTTSRYGYLENHGKTKLTELTEAEIGKFVDSSLHSGYIITIYPETKRGVFVGMECTNSSINAHP